MGWSVFIELRILLAAGCVARAVAAPCCAAVRQKTTMAILFIITTCCATQQSQVTGVTHHHPAHTTHNVLCAGFAYVTTRGIRPGTAEGALRAQGQALPRVLYVRPQYVRRCYRDADHRAGARRLPAGGRLLLDIDTRGRT